MNHIILSLKEKKLWNEYFHKLPIEFQDIYFTPEYYELYERYGDGEALCYVFEDDNKIAIYPFFKNNINSLGYTLDNQYFDIQGVYGYNGVAYSHNDTDFIKNFHESFNKFCKHENIIAEFSRFNPILKNFEFSTNNMVVLFDRKTVCLNISANFEDIWSNAYSSNNRNMIRKALKYNIKIIEGKQKEDYIDFYNIYTETMNNVNSKQYFFFNEQYFLDFISLLSTNHKLILAKLDEETIGGMILMTQGNYAHYHLSARKAKYNNYALNNLFLDFAIKEAKKQNCTIFHFGGGTSSNEKDSLLKFKANFSKEKADFHIGKKIHNKQIYNNIIDQWEKKNPQKKAPLKNILLKYRM